MIDIFRISSSLAQQHSLGAKKSHSSQDEWDFLSFSAVLTTASRTQLSVAFGQTERSSCAANAFGLSSFWSTTKLDSAKLLFKVHHIFLESEEQTLSAFGRADLAVAQVQAELDAQVFKEFIAPSLEIAVRFVGEEPLSPVTQVYNQALAQAFGQDLDLKIIPRLEKDGQVISATRVRAAIQAGKLADWVNLVPQSTYHYIQSQDLLGQDAQREKVE